MYQRTALHIACLCDQVEIADILLRRHHHQKNRQETAAGKSITVLPDIFGYLPMHFCQSSSMVELLNRVSLFYQNNDVLQDENTRLLYLLLFTFLVKHSTVI